MAESLEIVVFRHLVPFAPCRVRRPAVIVRDGSHGSVDELLYGPSVRGRLGAVRVVVQLLLLRVSRRREPPRVARVAVLGPGLPPLRRLIGQVAAAGHVVEVTGQVVVELVVGLRPLVLRVVAVRLPLESHHRQRLGRVGHPPVVPPVRVVFQHLLHL